MGDTSEPVPGWRPDASYGVPVTRTALTLAALATAAVPGLAPQAVASLVTYDGDDFDAAVLTDADGRRWVVRAPQTPLRGAALDQVQPLLKVLARKSPFKVPLARGCSVRPDLGTAVVYPWIDGSALDAAALEPESPAAASLGRAISALHNTDVRLAEEAGVPMYDAAGYRARRIGEIDRAAHTGHVPQRLLERWGAVLADREIWDFVPVLTHGALLPGQILLDPGDDENEPRVVAILGWERAQVADPADDLAPLAAEASPEALESVLQAYRHTRIERVDPHLLLRTRLVAELGDITLLTQAVARRDEAGIEAVAERLRLRAEGLDGEPPLRERPASPQARASDAPAGVVRYDDATDGEPGDALWSDDETVLLSTRIAVTNTTEGDPDAPASPSPDTGTDAVWQSGEPTPDESDSPLTIGPPSTSYVVHAHAQPQADTQPHADAPVQGHLGAEGDPTAESATGEADPVPPTEVITVRPSGLDLEDYLGSVDDDTPADGDPDASPGQRPRDER